MIKTRTHPTVFVIAAFIAFGSGCIRDCGRPYPADRGVVGVKYTDAQGNEVADIKSPVYDFDRVPMGSTKTLKFVVQNLGGSALELVAIEKQSGAPVQIGSSGDASPVFTLAFAPSTINVNAAKEFDLVFAPPTEADAFTRDWEAKVILRSGNTDPATPEQAAVTITFKGTGVSKACAPPEELDFGAVVIDALGTQSLTLANPTALDVTATVGAISGDAAAFSLAAGSPSGEVVIPARGERTIQFNFKPTQARDSLAFVDVRVAQQCNTSSRVRLVGTGAGALVTIAPAALDFGLLTPPASQELELRIRNNSATQPCVVSTVELAAGSDVIFSLPDGPVQDLVLPPGDTLRVKVRAWPQGALPATIVSAKGAVTVNLAHPDSSVAQRTIPLEASIGKSCLAIAPSALDFGTVGVGCSSATRAFTVYNTCPTAVTFNGYAMVSPAGAPPGAPGCPGSAPCPEFLAVSTSQIAPNTVLASGAAPSSFSLRYRPIDTGPDTGAFLLGVTQNGQRVDSLVTVSGRGDAQGLNVDTFVVPAGRPKADLLLVIDDSSSMAAKQTSLARNLDNFIAYLTAQDADYQLGVTTTDVSPSGPAGKLISKPGLPKILTPLTPNVVDAFKAQVAVGTLGSETESTLEPALLALTAPLITGDNAGFLRSDATLSVVVVSDASDQSTQPAWFYVNQFLSIKGAQRPYLFAFNAIAPTLATAPASCPGGYDSSWNGSDPRLALAVTGTQGVREEICTPDWSKALEAVGKTAFGSREQFYLTAPADLTRPVTVKIDGVTLQASDARGDLWNFDPLTNAIIFEPLFAPGPGQTLTVSYFAPCN